MKKIRFVRHQLHDLYHFFFKLLQWVKLMTCSYTCREYILYRKRWLCVKKMTGHHIKTVGFLLQAKEAYP